MRNPFRRNEGEEKALTASGGVPAAIQEGWSAVPLLDREWREAADPRDFQSCAGRELRMVVRQEPGTQECDRHDRPGRRRSSICGCSRSVFRRGTASQEPDHAAALSMRYPNEGTRRRMVWFVACWRGLADSRQRVRIAGAWRWGIRSRWSGSRRTWWSCRETACSRSTITGFGRRVRGRSVGSWGGAGSWIDVPPGARCCTGMASTPRTRGLACRTSTRSRGVIAEDAALQQATVEEPANAGLQEPTWVFRLMLTRPTWSECRLRRGSRRS